MSNNILEPQDYTEPLPIALAINGLLAWHRDFIEVYYELNGSDIDTSHMTVREWENQVSILYQSSPASIKKEFDDLLFPGYNTRLPIENVAIIIFILVHALKKYTAMLKLLSEKYTKRIRQIGTN